MQNNTSINISIVGLGYVGLTLAVSLVEVGCDVIGIEKREEIVNMTNKGIPHFQEKGLADQLERALKSGRFSCKSKFDKNLSSDIYIITVGTPLDKEGNARLDIIENATNEVAENMKEGALVILRSTVKVGTTRNVVNKILEKTGKEFSIAMCPERTLEGKALDELREIPQIIGADDVETRIKASTIFRKLTKRLVEVSSLETAELIKLVDNTYRDVQFAFGNELARACEAYKVNAYEVISSGKIGYERTNVAMPGLVGGPCLEKDPHILLQSLSSFNIDLEITKAARLINERQPLETINFILNQMKKRGIKNSDKITILGLAFKGIPETDDLRGSMSLRVLYTLQKLIPNIEVSVFDPVVKEEALSYIKKIKIFNCKEEAIRDSSVVIITNNHPSLTEINPYRIYDLMKPNGFIYDYWNNFSMLDKDAVGSSYFSVGNIHMGQDDQ